MDNGQIRFTKNQDKYRMQIGEHLNLQKEESTFSPDQYLDKLANEQDFLQEHDGQNYKVNFESVEEFEESQKIMTSDEELVSYYEKNDPDMLQGLKSKSSINVAGKKSEKKKLRAKYLEAHSDEMKEQTVVKEKFDELIEKDKKEGVNVGRTTEEIKKQMREDDINNIMDCFKIQNKTPKQLKAIRKKVSGLSYSRRKQLLRMTENTLANADLNGIDTEEVRAAQERVAKSHVSNADRDAFLIQRQARQFDADHPLPENTQELDKKATFHTGGEFLERTAKAYMKEVKFVVKDGKKVPASPEYEENLKFNQKFIDSLYSDDENDWDFRFIEMEKNIDKMWSDYTKPMKDILDGKFDFNNNDLDMMVLYEHARKHLCFSGLGNERTSFFRSKYYKSLPKERQKELEDKNDVLAPFLRLFELKVADKGLNPSGFKYQSENGTKVSSKEMLGPLTQMVQMQKDRATPYL